MRHLVDIDGRIIGAFFSLLSPVGFWAGRGDVALLCALGQVLRPQRGSRGTEENEL